MSATEPFLVPITVLNTAPEETFFHYVNILFETAPPLSKALVSGRPYDSYQSLIDKAEKAITTLSPEERIEVINAHPRIGANPRTTQLSALSYKEQGCHTDSVDEELERVMRELGQLNEEYENKFGFKFVVWVNGRSKKEIIPVLRERLSNPREQELATGLQAMMDIARDRLSKLTIRASL